MSNRIIFGCVLLALLPPAVWAQANTPSQAASEALILGIWRCEMEGLPAVTLTVTNEGGSLTGAVLFYLHRREPSQPVTATPGVPEPLFNVHFDGHTLTFDVSHRRAHPPRTLNDPPVVFELRLDGAERAQLINENEKMDPNAPEYFLTRTDY